LNEPYHLQRREDLLTAASSTFVEPMQGGETGGASDWPGKGLNIMAGAGQAQAADATAPDCGASSENAARDESALWTALAAARGVGEFCRAWLAILCNRTAGAGSGLILLANEAGAFAPAAIWPVEPIAVEALAEAGKRALASGRPLVEPHRHVHGTTLLAYPVARTDRPQGVVVLAIAGADADTLQSVMRNLHWGIGWIQSLTQQHGAAVASGTGEAAGSALELLAAVQEEDELERAALVLCNELCRISGAHSAALGLEKDKAIRLLATSHGAWFRKRSNFAEAIEAAMDEAFDQRATIAWPEEDGNAHHHVTLQHARLAGTSGGGALLSVPLEDRGRIVGVATLERDAEAEEFGEHDVALVEGCLALIAPGITSRQREARLVSGKIRERAMDGARALFGPRKPFAKVLGIAAVVLLAILLLPVSPFRIAADAELEGSVQRAASVPFSGFIARSDARAGDLVEEGQVLARLDDRELKLDYAKALSEAQQLDRKYREALAGHERSGMNLAGAQLRQAQAQLRLIRYKLGQVDVVAPISGVLVSGDVSQRVGSPVKEGEVLFEVAPLGDYRVVLQVRESDISYIHPGQKGAFAPTGLAGRTVPFTVTKLSSVTSSEEGNNTFRVEASLDRDAVETLRPGMEGVAKVTVGRAGKLWIWTRGARDWLRLFLWEWTP